MARLRVYVLLAVVALFAPSLVEAQAQAQAPAPATPPDVLTLDQAIQYATDHYPSVRAAFEDVNASAAGITVARAAYLPRLDSLWQANRATANNIVGQLLPQSVIPALSGPVLPSTSAQAVWGSAAGALFSWEPVDFGLRHATIVGAEASLTRARANEALTRLDVQAAVANVFLGVLRAQREVAAAQADFARRDVLQRAVHVLVDNQLRPGADASRADAERAAAQTRVIRAQQSFAVAQATFARVLGLTTGVMGIRGDELLARLPSTDLGLPTPANAHPLAQVQQAAVNQARAQADVLARSDLPRVFLESSVFARGSGANPNGVFDLGADGLGFERVNWAAGVQVIFPNLFDFSTLRARKTAAAASARAESARYDETLLTVMNQQQTAAAFLQAARAVAANTPIQLAAAQQTEKQAKARYDAGLAGIVELADAQDLLAQAEVDDQLARVDVWRALLEMAVAQGNLTPFVNLVQQP